MKVSCGECRYWTPLGDEDSGLTRPNSTEPWRYRVGSCAQAGALGLPFPGDTGVPEWSSCHLSKARSHRAGKEQAA